MAIQLHSFVSTEKRYVQVESQLHHIIGIYKKIVQTQAMRSCKIADIYSAYYECEEDGTITFYQAELPKLGQPGIWTYLVYECPQGEEKVFRDASVKTNLSTIKRLFAGEQLSHVAVDIKEYLKYKTSEEGEYFDILLPDFWNNITGRKLVRLLLDEYKALQSSSVFAQEIGIEYQNEVLDAFIGAATEVLETGGSTEEFEAVQHDVLKIIQVDKIANYILELNDYRIWQEAMPSKSKAVEHAFNTALNFICKMK